MILSSISPPRAGRPGDQSDSRWTCVHHALPRAAGRANRRRSRSRLAQRPVQTHGQVTSQGHLGHVSASPENQTFILAPQFGIKLRCAVASLHQQPTQHFIALLADVSQPLVTAAGILARVQPQITDQLAAVRKTLDRTYGQHRRPERSPAPRPCASSARPPPDGAPLPSGPPDRARRSAAADLPPAAGKYVQWAGPANHQPRALASGKPKMDARSKRAWLGRSSSSTPGGLGSSLTTGLVL